MAEAKYKMRGTAGQTIARKMYVVAYKTEEGGKLVGIGKRVEESSAENDHNTSTLKDILGGVYGTMETPVITQTFDEFPLDPGDEFQQKILQLHVIEQNMQALANMELYRIHLHLTDESGNAFCERYPSCMVEPTGYGGAGGGNLTQPITVTFGGERETGHVTVDEDGSMTYTKGDAGA